MCVTKDASKSSDLPLTNPESDNAPWIMAWVEAWKLRIVSSFQKVPGDALPVGDSPMRLDDDKSVNHSFLGSSVASGSLSACDIFCLRESHQPPQAPEEQVGWVKTSAGPGANSSQSLTTSPFPAPPTISTTL